MTREEAKYFYPILQAFTEGKVIKYRTKSSAVSKSLQDLNRWLETKCLSFESDLEYCIKPESKYRPFKNGEECCQEMQKHQPFGWVKIDDWYCSIEEIKPVCFLSWWRRCISLCRYSKANKLCRWNSIRSKS